VPDKSLELRAAAAVASIVGACYCLRDTGAPKMRDFDLIFPDRHPEPLEITEATLESVRHTQSRLQKVDMPAPSVRRLWTIENAQSRGLDQR
jgi:hypothetical protein